MSAEWKQERSGPKMKLASKRKWSGELE